MKITENETTELSSLITKIIDKIKIKKGKSKVIEILTLFKQHFQKMKRFNRRKSQYARRISDIITKEKSNNNRTITLSRIQKIYTEKFKTNISLTTISRVLRNHLDLHFKRTKIKNPKLNKLNYKFMGFLFLKCVVRAINNNLNIY